MHSRIFQVSKEPITEDNKISEYRYEEGFVGNNGVDYVVPTENKQADLEWLTICHSGLDVNVSYDADNKPVVKLTILSKEEYFTKKFDEFKEGLAKLQDYTLEDFMNNANWLDMYRLKDAYNNEHGFYIDDNDEYHGITTFDEFVRSTNDGDVFYIGAVFDYHF